MHRLLLAAPMPHYRSVFEAVFWIMLVAGIAIFTHGIATLPSYLGGFFCSPTTWHEIAGSFGDAVLAIAPMVAAMGDVAALMELGHPLALFFGLLISAYAAVALSYKRAFDALKSYPGVRKLAPAGHSSSSRSAMDQLQNAVAGGRMSRYDIART